MLAAVPAWIYVYSFYSHVSRVREAESHIAGPHWDTYHELGSVAMPFPPLVRYAGQFALLCSVVGISIMLFDLLRWMQKRTA